MILFISIQFLISVISCINWFFEHSKYHFKQLSERLPEKSEDPHSDIENTLKQLKKETQALIKVRKKASAVNKKAMILIFILALIFGTGIVFLKPELILYYRAEIQLRTFRKPETAFLTFEHLTKKYPDYRFIDNIFYRMAWIKDRRMKDSETAEKLYLSFLKKFSEKKFVGR